MNEPRPGTKIAAIVERLKSPNGVTNHELTAAGLCGDDSHFWRIKEQLQEYYGYGINVVGTERGAWKKRRRRYRIVRRFNAQGAVVEEYAA